MLVSYIDAGFDPAAFWDITPRLYMLHMRGAEARLKREAQDRREQAWFIAYLPSAKEPPALNEFVTGEKDNAARREKLMRSWDRMDRALARNTG